MLSQEICNFLFFKKLSCFLGHSVHSSKGFMRQPILNLVLVANVEHPWMVWIAVKWDKTT